MNHAVFEMGGKFFVYEADESGEAIGEPTDGPFDTQAEAEALLEEVTDETETASMEKPKPVKDIYSGEQANATFARMRAEGDYKPSKDPKNRRFRKKGKKSLEEGELEPMQDPTATAIAELKNQVKALQADAASRVTGVKDLEAERPFKNLGEQMLLIRQAALQPHATDKRLLHGNEVAAKAVLGMNEGVGSEGGFAIHPQFSDTLQERALTTGEILNRVTTQEIGPNSNEYSELQVDDTSQVEGSQFGGVAVYWVGEGGTISATKPALKRFALKLKKVVAMTYATDEQLQDATQLGSFLQRVYPQAMSFSIENAIFRGQDAAKPQGVLYAAGAVSVAKEPNQTANTIVYKNIQKMWGRLYADSRANSAWFLNQDAEEQLYSMSLPVGTGGVPVLLPPSGASVQPYGTLFGRPIIPLKYASTVGTKGDISLIDFSQVLLVKKGGADFQSSIYAAWDTAQTSFRWVQRVNAGLRWSSAITPAQGSNTQSPVVFLDTRA